MFYVKPEGWGFVIEADLDDMRWLAGFLRTKTRTPADLERAGRLYDSIAQALGGELDA